MRSICNKADRHRTFFFHRKPTSPAKIGAPVTANAMTNDRPLHTDLPVTESEPSRRRIEVADLLGDAREVCLVHGDAEYLLRLTSNGKLLLTK